MMGKEAPGRFRLWYGYPTSPAAQPPPPPPPGQFSSQPPPPPPPPPQTYPFSGFVPTPSQPQPPPPGFRPPSDAQSCGFYQAGWWRPPPPVLFYYPPNGFHGAPNPLHYPATGWMQSSVSAPQPQNFISPGITPSIKTPGIQEVRQDQVIHPLQPCQWQPRAGRAKDAILVVNNAFSAVEGVGSTKLQKSISSERIELERSTVSGDQEKEKQYQKIHQHLSKQEKEKTKTRTEQISYSDYACSTAGGGGTSEGNLQERSEPEAPSIADCHGDGRQGISHLSEPSQAQNRSSGQFNNISVVKDAHDTAIGDIGHRKSQEFTSSMRGESEAPLLTDFQDGRQAPASDQMQPSSGKAKEKSRQDRMSTNASAVEGVRSKKLQTSASSERIELEMSAVADDQEKGKQDPKGHQHQSTQENEKAKTQTVEKSVSDNAFSAAGGGTSEGNLQYLITCKLIEPEAPQIADSQGISLLCQPSQAPEKPEQCNNISMVKDVPDTNTLYSWCRKSKVFKPSMGDESEARARYQMQPSPGKANEKRQHDQMTSMEDVPNTSQGGEFRERKLQKLISSEKDELEAAATSQNSFKDSACNTVALPIAQMTLGFHDLEESCSLTSSTLNWVSSFDDVSSNDVGYWGNGEMVKVGSYMVEQKQSATMEAILKKYGDIAKDCGKKSTMFRSYIVQGICEVVEGLQIPIEQLSHDQLKMYMCFVKEALVMGLSVKWLEERLDEVSEIIDAMKEYKHLRDTRKANTEKMKALEKEIGLKEAENWKFESEVEKLQSLFEADMLEVKKKKSAINDVKLRFKAIPKRLLDGLY